MKVGKKKARLHKNALMPVRPLKLWQDEPQNTDVRIEIIPLIDVIFCILTFFILAAVSFSRQQAITLDLPKAETGESQMQEMLVISLDNLGQIYVEKELVTRKKLTQTLKNYRVLNPEGLMVLYASKTASYKDVIDVLDALREVGGDRVALATLPVESQTPDNFNPYDYQFPENQLENPNYSEDINQYEPLIPVVPAPLKP